MRSFRLLALALTATAGLIPSMGGAQGRAAGWQDSWYWGAYGGGTSISTLGTSLPSSTRTYAPMAGGEWVLTRSRYALNLFLEQSFFNAVSTVADYPTGARTVNMTDMRRMGFAAMLFVGEHRLMKPYVGLGYAMNFIKKAALADTSFTGPAGPAARDTVLRRLDNARTEGKVFANVGVMLMYRKFAPFAQYGVMPTRGKGTSLLNGEGFAYVFSAGLRYNFGTAIEK